MLIGVKIFSYCLSKNFKYIILFLFQSFFGAITIVDASNSNDALPLFIDILSPISNKKILPNYPEFSEEINPVLRIYAAPNEFEPASFAIKSNESLSSVSISITDLKNGSIVIPSEKVDIKLVKVWYQADEAWYGRYGKKKIKNLVPELLLNNDQLIQVDFNKEKNFINVQTNGQKKLIDISIPGNKRGVKIHEVKNFNITDSNRLQMFNLPKYFVKQIWLTLTPAEIESGTYTGSVIITDSKERERVLPIEVYIRDFYLCEPDKEYGIYYRSQLRPNRPTISSEYKNVEQLRNELINMKEHGVINPNVYQSYNNPDLLDKYLSIRSEVGLSNKTIYYHGIRTGRNKTVYSFEEVKSQYDRIKSILLHNGVKNLYVYGIDEARGDTLSSQRELWKMLRKENIKIYAAGREEVVYSIGDELDLLVHRRSPKPELARRMHELGHKIFSYNNPQVGAENPYVHRKNYGIDIWRAGYDGVMNYAYMTSFQSVWNDFDHKFFRDHNYVYPTSTGVIDTIAWEGFREGVDDVRYISTLQKLSAHLNANSEKARKIKSYLHGLNKGSVEALQDMRNSISELLKGENVNCN